MTINKHVLAGVWLAAVVGLAALEARLPASWGERAISLGILLGWAEINALFGSWLARRALFRSLLLLWLLLALPSLLTLGSGLLFSHYRVAGETVLSPDEAVLVDRWAYVGSSTPRRGDLIVGIDPKDEPVKGTVVGIPGDRVEAYSLSLWQTCGRINGALKGCSKQLTVPRGGQLEAGQLYWSRAGGLFSHELFGPMPVSHMVGMIALKTSCRSSFGGTDPCLPFGRVVEHPEREHLPLSSWLVVVAWRTAVVGVPVLAFPGLILFPVLLTFAPRPPHISSTSPPPDHDVTARLGIIQSIRQTTAKGSAATAILRPRRTAEKLFPQLADLPPDCLERLYCLFEWPRAERILFCLHDLALERQQLRLADVCRAFQVLCAEQTDLRRRLAFASAIFNADWFRTLQDGEPLALLYDRLLQLARGEVEGQSLDGSAINGTGQLARSLRGASVLTNSLLTGQRDLPVSSLNQVSRPERRVLQALAQR